MLTKNLKNTLDTSPLLAASIEFTVGKRSGSPLSKTIIRLRVDSLFPTDKSYILATVMHVFPSFDNDRTNT